MPVLFFQFPLTLPVKHGTEDINVPICQPPKSRDLSSKARSKVVQYASNQCFHSQDDLGLSRPSALCIFLATVLKRNLPFSHLYQWSRDRWRNSLLPWLNAVASVKSVSTLFLEAYREIVWEKGVVHALFRLLKGPCPYHKLFLSRIIEPDCETGMCSHSTWKTEWKKETLKVLHFFKDWNPKYKLGILWSAMTVQVPFQVMESRIWKAKTGLQLPFCCKTKLFIFFKLYQ